MTTPSWIVLVDDAAVSYCYYESYRYLPGPSRPMARDLLETVICRAGETGAHLQFVLGNELLPAEHYAMMDRVPHVKILPLGSKHDVQDGIFVVGREDYRQLQDIEEGSRCTLNLRVERDFLPSLASLVETALVRSTRVNVMLLNLDLYHEEDFLEYREQLQSLARFLEERFRQRDVVECNLFADAVSMPAGHDCGAGITHFTIAPDGRFYVCPGFFYDGLGKPCGDLQSGVRIPNARLFARDFAPLCRSCALVHCPRCVYLNKKTTVEVNTPSQQQCVAAHLEQAVSAHLFARLREGSWRGGSVRPRLDYRALDPFIRIQAPSLESGSPGSPGGQGPEGPAGLGIDVMPGQTRRSS